MKLLKQFFIFILLFIPLQVLPSGIRSLEPIKKEKSLCLIMVVKDVQKTIYSTLHSLKKNVDCFFVYDLESSDDTVYFVEDFLADTGIPGKVFRNKSKDIHFNKTQALKLAQKTLQELGFNLHSTYFLLLDPDMTLNISPSFNKNNLEEDAYLILEKSSALTCCKYNARLLKASLNWESNGIVHEYWTLKGQAPSIKLRTISVEDRSDDQSRHQKLREYVKQIHLAMESEPSNERYLFYLAQTYKGLGEYDAAIEYYNARIAKEEKQDEVWFSKYMIGECYEEMGRWDHALYWYLEAYQFNPKRGDPIWKIATHYRLKGQNDLSYIFAKYGSSVPFLHSATLFSNPPFNDYQFDEELSVVAYYTRHKDVGFDAANGIIFRRNVPGFIKENTYRNMIFYLQNIPNAEFKPIHIDLPIIQDGYDELYHPMNPSIQKTEWGYKMICRTVNFTQEDARQYYTIDETGMFRTRNFLINYDPNFNLLTQQEIIEDLPREKVRSFNIIGQEDCRIFEYQNQSWFTCTTSDTNPCGNLQISLCKMAETEDEIVPVDKLVPLLGPDPYRCEKNWLPFIVDDELRVIYSYDPFVIKKVNPDTGVCETILEYDTGHDLSRLRGSAAPIAFDNGYLVLVHEAIIMPDYRRYYMHRFLFLDKNFMLERLSRPFTFMHSGVEYCCSMTLDHAENKLVLPIGYEDREAYFCFLDLDNVRSMLHPLPLKNEAIPKTK